MIDPGVLMDENLRMYAMMMIFARGLCDYAGEIPDPVESAAAGMDEVFEWWCAHGFPGDAGDVRETGALVAQSVAEHLGYDQGVMDEAVDRLYDKWQKSTCPDGSKRKWSGYVKQARPQRLALKSAGRMRALPPA